mmetsp:Transcript_37765/g.31930  ORF Transcript_37765/g.31930 Transcript_37765/m.31930 type:complete len:82 (-) Transcript_37765:247-492(-)
MAKLNIVPPNLLKSISFSISQISIESGGFHNCMIIPNSNHLVCWGSNERGQLNAPENVRYRRVHTISYSLGYLHTCAIDHL